MYRLALLVGIAISLWPQFNSADFEAFLEVINANGNDELCWAEQMPPHGAKYGEPFHVANFIDDVSNSQK